MGSKMHFCFALCLFLGLIDCIEAGPLPKSLGRGGRHSKSHGKRPSSGSKTHHRPHPTQSLTHKSTSLESSGQTHSGIPLATSSPPVFLADSSIGPSLTISVDFPSPTLSQTSTQSLPGSSAGPLSTSIPPSSALSQSSTQGPPGSSAGPLSTSILPSSALSQSSTQGLPGSSRSSLSTPVPPSSSQTFSRSSPSSTSPTTCTLTAILFLPTSQFPDSILGPPGSTHSASPSVLTSSAPQSALPIPTTNILSNPALRARATPPIPSTLPAQLSSLASPSITPPTTTPSVGISSIQPTPASSTTIDGCVVVTETRYYIYSTNGPINLPSTPSAASTSNLTPSTPSTSSSTPTAISSVSSTSSSPTSTSSPLISTSLSSLSSALSSPTLTPPLPVMVSTSSQLAVSSSIPSVTTLSTPTPVAASTLSSAVDESATTPPIATTTATDFIVRIRISETVAVSTSTNVFTELSTVTVTSDPRIFTTVTPIVRTSTTLVPVSTGATVPDSISLSSHHKMVVVAGSVSAAVASVFVALIACIVCRRRRRRPASASSSFFSAPRATTNSVGAAPLSPSSTSRSRSPLFAPRSMDLEQGAEEMLDALDHAGPALQVPVRENQAIPFLRTHGGPQNVAVVPPMKGQAESTAWSITERTSAESSESSISEKSVNCRTGEHSDLQRSDTVHSNPPPDYATSCAS